MATTDFAIGFDRAQAAYDAAEPDWVECECGDDCPRSCPCQELWCPCGEANAKRDRQGWEDGPCLGPEECIGCENCEEDAA